MAFEILINLKAICKTTERHKTCSYKKGMYLNKFKNIKGYQKIKKKRI